MDFFRAHYHHMISELVGQIVMDRRGSVSVNDFSSTYNVSVANLIEKFSELDRLQQLEAEASENREQVIRLAAENRELKLELEHWRNQSNDGQAPAPVVKGTSSQNRRMS